MYLKLSNYKPLLFKNSIKDLNESNKKKARKINLHSLCQKEKEQQKKPSSTHEVTNQVTTKPNNKIPFSIITSIMSPLHNH